MGVEVDLLQGESITLPLREGGPREHTLGFVGKSGDLRTNKGPLAGDFRVSKRREPSESSRPPKP